MSDPITYDLKSLLKSKGCIYLYDKFIEHGIDELNLLLRLKKVDLYHILNNKNDTIKVLEIIEDLKVDMNFDKNITENYVSDFVIKNNIGMSLMADNKHIFVNEDSNKNNLFQKYTNKHFKYDFGNENFRMKTGESDSIGNVSVNKTRSPYRNINLIEKNSQSFEERLKNISRMNSDISEDSKSFGSILGDNSFQNNKKIQVVVRKKPVNNQKDIIKVDGNNIIVDEPRVRVDLTPYVERHTFAFDRAFSGEAPTYEIYKNCVEGIVNHFLKGENGTIIAYGQTGTGKTYTLLDSNSGLLYEVLKKILNKPVKINFYEIYMGRIYDLLNYRERVNMLENNGKIHIKDLTTCTVNSLNEAISLFNKGFLYRKTGITGANNESSRSHAIIKVIQDGELCFVDLAGSERGNDRKNVDSHTKNEGAEINKSLLALKECIRGIDKNHKYLPFRHSKLTQILKSSFMGNSKTLVIATVSGNITDSEHALNTLRYAYRIREINVPQKEEYKSKEIKNLNSKVNKNYHINHCIENQIQSLEISGKKSKIYCNEDSNLFFSTPEKFINLNDNYRNESDDYKRRIEIACKKMLNEIKNVNENKILKNVYSRLIDIRKIIDEYKF